MCSGLHHCLESRWNLRYGLGIDTSALLFCSLKKDFGVMWNRWGEREEHWYSLTSKELHYLDENLVGEYEFLERIIRYDKYVIDTFDKVVSVAKKENRL